MKTPNAPANGTPIDNAGNLTNAVWYQWFVQIANAVSLLYSNFQIKTVIFADATKKIDNTASTWVFNGGTTTCQLPDPAKSTDVLLIFKNRGSGTMTLLGNIFGLAIATSVVISSGGSYRIQSDGVYWNSI